MMKIQVWSDFRCPFCYIGHQNLEQAIAQSSKDVEIEIMSYELAPDIQPQRDQSYVEQLAGNIGLSVSQAQLRLSQIDMMAKKAGLNYDFNNMIDANSFKIHRVFQMAKQLGKGNEFFKVGMAAHFTHGLDIADEQTLIDLALQVGMSEEDTKKALQSDEIAYQVRTDEATARNIGVQGVPHFVLDDKVFVSGAQPVESFIEAIEYVESLSSNLACSDESCIVP